MSLDLIRDACLAEDIARDLAAVWACRTDTDLSSVEQARTLVRHAIGSLGHTLALMDAWQFEQIKGGQ